MSDQRVYLEQETGKQGKGIEKRNIFSPQQIRFYPKQSKTQLH